MSQINDAIKTVVGSQINDGLATYYGKTAGESINDATRRWLIANGATPAHISDMWYQFLRSSGYSGSMQEMLLAFWVAGGGTPPLVVDPPWITDFTAFTRDANGWTVFTPNASSQIVYVDATNGNDATALIYDATDTVIFNDPFTEHVGILAFETVQAALATRRDNEPDWVLLKKGEYWDVDQDIINLSMGRNATERQFLGSYGASTVRPILDSDNVALRLWNGIRFNSVFGIDFYDSRRDPNHVNFKGWLSATSNAVGVLGYDSGNIGIIPNGYLLMEDCVVRFFYQGHTMTGSGINPDMQYRRCQFLDMHDWNRLVSVGFGGAEMHSFLDECLLDHNGWFEKVQARYSQTVTTTLNGATETSVVVSAPIPVTAPATGAIGLAPDSVSGSGDNATDIRVEYTSFTGSTFTIVSTDFTGDNVSAGNSMTIVTSDADSRNHNHYCADARKSIRKNNISLRPSSIHMKYSANPDVAPNSIYSWDVSIYGNLFAEGEVIASYGGNTDFDDGERFRNYIYKDNVSMFIGRSQPSHRTLGWGAQVIDNLNSVVEGNYFLHTDNPSVSGNFIVDVIGHNTNVSITNNLSKGIANIVNAIDLTKDANFTNVTEGNNAIELPDGYYVDPTRTIETYMISIGETGTLDAFAIRCREQSKDNWDLRYTADAVNTYVKAGYQLDIAVPIITQQPQNLPNLVPPQTGTFTIDTYSNLPTTYQWYNGAGIIVGATDKVYTTPPTIDGQTDIFYCEATSDGNTVTSTSATLASNVLSLSLTFKVGSFAEITPVTLTGNDGDYLEFTYEANTFTATGYPHSRGGAVGGISNLRAGTSNRWFFNSTVAITIDNTAIASGTQIPANFDGTPKTLRLTPNAGQTEGVGGIACQGLNLPLASGNFIGVIRDVTLSVGGVITTYNIDSGSITTDTADVGVGTMTYNNVIAGDWA